MTFDLRFSGPTLQPGEIWLSASGGEAFAKTLLYVPAGVTSISRTIPMDVQTPSDVTATATAASGLTGSASSTFRVVPQLTALTVSGTEPFHVGSTSTLTATLNAAPLYAPATVKVTSPLFDDASITVLRSGASASVGVTFTATGSAAASATGTSGAVGSASTPAVTVYSAAVAPTGATGYASGVGLNAATLNATVDPGNDHASVVFEYGTTAAYGSETSAQAPPLGGPSLVSAPVAGLTPGTEYHYRVKAVNGVSTLTGDDSYFATWNPTAGDMLLMPSSGGSAEAPDAASLHPASAWTLEAWVRPDDIGTPHYIVSKGTSDTAPGQYGLRLTGPGHAAFAFSDGTTAAAVGATPLNAGNWYHIAGTWDGTSMSVYLNGVLDGTLERPGPIAVNTGALQIGRLSAGLYPWVGALDEVRVWNTARSAAEIQDGMHKVLTGSEPGLVAYYRCDDGAGVTLTDATASHNDAALSGPLLWAPSLAPLSAPFAVPEATLALRIAAGLAPAGSVDYYRLNIAPSPPDTRIDVLDAMRLARKAAGVEANP